MKEKIVVSSMIFPENKLPCCNVKITIKLVLQSLSRKYTFRKTIGREGGGRGGRGWAIKLVPL